GSACAAESATVSDTTAKATTPKTPLPSIEPPFDVESGGAKPSPVADARPRVPSPARADVAPIDVGGAPAARDHYYGASTHSRHAALQPDSTVHGDPPPSGGSPQVATSSTRGTTPSSCRCRLTS